MTSDEKRDGTGGDPAGGADPGGTRPKPKDQGNVETDKGVQSGDRNDMTKSDPIKP